MICPKCKKLGTTKVTGWDGKEVQYCCEKTMVTWAQGCGFCGKISPFDGNAKLPWKVDWPSHWNVLGITFEGAGKDHASRGGSYDIAFALCDEVFKIPKPYYFPYEFFLFGGKKMSSSKGIGLKGRDLTSILPPEVARFLIVRTIPQKALEFDPIGDTIPKLFDEFDRCAKAFWEKGDEDLSRIFELSQVNDHYTNPLFLPRFKDIAATIQFPHVDINKRFEVVKGSLLTSGEKEILSQRQKYARIWLDTYAPDEDKFAVSDSLPDIVGTLSPEQKKYLKNLVEIINKHNTADELQQGLFALSKEQNISPKEAFQAIYTALLGRSSGPKAGWLLSSLDKELVKRRFLEVGLTAK